MGLSTFINRISLLHDCRVIMKLMAKAQRSSYQEKAILYLYIEKKLKLLAEKSETMPEAAVRVVIPMKGKALNNDLFSFLQMVDRDLERLKKQDSIL